MGTNLRPLTVAEVFNAEDEIVSRLERFAGIRHIGHLTFRASRSNRGYSVLLLSSSFIVLKNRAAMRFDTNSASVSSSSALSAKIPSGI